MLGDELNSRKLPSQSKSSFMVESMDQKKLVNMLEDKDKTIRKLTKKIQKLEDTIKKSTVGRAFQDKKNEESENDNKYLQLLKAEIQKTQKLEDIIEDITQRVNIILEDLSNDKTLTDNSQQIKMMLHQMETSKNQSFSSDFFENQLQRSINISAEWVKKIDVLQGVFKSYRIKFNSLMKDNQRLNNDVQHLKDAPDSTKLKEKHSEEIKQLSLQLKEEKKQREKMKKLLEKAEFQKNQLINKIHATNAKEADVKVKTKEELLQYSKELQFKVKDLEKQKESILKEATKDKQEDLKKYQDFLKKLKIIKEKSIMGKSCT